MPLYNPVVLEDEKELLVDIAGTGSCTPVRTIIPGGAGAMLEEAICKASLLTSLRIGDYVAVELAPVSVLADQSAGEVAVHGTFCENEIFGFKIIF